MNGKRTVSVTRQIIGIIYLDKNKHDMTQKQFNIDDARKIMTGEMYGKVMTRDGFPVTILVWDLRPSFPLGGIVHLGDNNDYLREWTAKGKADKRPNVTMRCDLVLEVKGGEA